MVGLFVPKLDYELGFCFLIESIKDVFLLNYVAFASSLAVSFIVECLGAMAVFLKIFS